MLPESLCVLLLNKFFLLEWLLENYSSFELFCQVSTAYLKLNFACRTYLASRFFVLKDIMPDTLFNVFKLCNFGLKYLHKIKCLLYWNVCIYNRILLYKLLLGLK